MLDLKKTNQNPNLPSKYVYMNSNNFLCYSLGKKEKRRDEVMHTDKHSFVPM